MPRPMRCCGGCTRNRRSSIRPSRNRPGDQRTRRSRSRNSRSSATTSAHRQRPRRSGQRRDIGIAHQPRHILFGRDRKQARRARRARAERQRFAAAEAVVVGKRHPRARRRCRPPRSVAKNFSGSPMPAKASTGLRWSSAKRLRVRFEPAVKHRQALRAQAAASTGRASTGSARSPAPPARGRAAPRAAPAADPPETPSRCRRRGGRRPRRSTGPSAATDSGSRRP